MGEEFRPKVKNDTSFIIIPSTFLVVGGRIIVMKFVLFIIIIIFNFKTLYADENLKGKQILCGKISLDQYEIESFQFISNIDIKSVAIGYSFLNQERYSTTFEYQYKLEPKQIKIFLYDLISTKEWKYYSSLNRRNLSITLNLLNRSNL